ncbi:hypothetical protein B0H15DRAFT_804319 [Mycena belliarum]|uniref:C3H1-type domain-containing protein n=1 Tax=Mycena belliarum TaxID=1033014 RepID=A0AAD6XHN7_9AGAR|nr:hypothetical protein B0H15DRAFT_804319 [Mycena belliae]
MSPPPSPNTKKPPQKKRHTKPCRYFQTGTCPHTAQDCDFAHVFSDQPAPAPKQCRYYLQGICTNGIWCQYRHGEGSTNEASLLEDYRNGNSLAGGRVYGAEFGRGSNSIQMRVEVVPRSLYVPPTFNGIYASPPSGLWSPYTGGFQSSFACDPSPPKSNVHNPAVFPLDSTDSATPSESPTSSVSDEGALLYPDDASGNHNAYFNCEPQATYLSSPLDDTAQFALMPMSVVPASYGMAPLYDIFSPKAPGFYPPTAIQPPPPSPCARINRLKLSNYRTKPCRYFKPGSVCPNGDACTFIHADPEQMESPSPLASPVNLQHELPAKPLSARESSIRKGYFPISWRVIGGGVLMGSNKDSDLSEDSFDGRADPVSHGLEIEIPASAPATAMVFPSLNKDYSDSMVTPTALSRPRALSIPSTPNTSHIDILRVSKPDPFVDSG